MSYQTITATRYKCKCEAVNKNGTVCGHEWESSELPRCCSLCKKRTWNGKDKRCHGEKITFRGESLTIKEWAAKLGMSAQVIRQRKARGWAIDEVFDTALYVPGRKPKEAA